MLNSRHIRGTAALASLGIVAAICGSQVQAQTPATAKPRIDLAFCIDTTGSMQGEIDNVKAKTKEIVAKLAGGKPTPHIRVGLVAFRDRGDEYVTKVFPFSEDIDKVVRDISSLKADGGGDGPEAVNEALHTSLHGLNWSTDKKTLKMLFLIGDAGPHHYENDYDWRAEAKKAISQGIQINTLACEGLQSYPEAQGTGVFKEIAKLSDGTFEPLTYRQEIATADGKKSTVVSSAGRVYKVTSDKADVWRAGVAALEAKKEVEELPARAGGAGGAGSRARMALIGKAATKGASLMALPASSPLAPGAFAAAARSESAGFASDSFSRKDSNLADIVLERAQKAAKQKLNVDFSTR